jgi:hypothetical protein
MPCCSQISGGCLMRALGVQQAATDRENTFTRNWGTLTPLHPEMGCENASTRDRGRRQRNSQMPRCNGVDTVKVCQGKMLDERNNG